MHTNRWSGYFSNKIRAVPLPTKTNDFIKHTKLCTQFLCFYIIQYTPRLFPGSVRLVTSILSSFYLCVDATGFPSSSWFVLLSTLLGIQLPQHCIRLWFRYVYTDMVENLFRTKKTHDSMPVGKSGCIICLQQQKPQLENLTRWIDFALFECDLDALKAKTRSTYTAPIAAAAAAAAE